MEAMTMMVIRAVGIQYLLGNWKNPWVIYTEALRWKLKSGRNELSQGERAEKGWELKWGGRITKRLNAHLDGVEPRSDHSHDLQQKWMFPPGLIEWLLDFGSNSLKLFLSLCSKPCLPFQNICKMVDRSAVLWCSRPWGCLDSSVHVLLPWGRWGWRPGTKIPQDL